MAGCCAKSILFNTFAMRNDLEKTNSLIRVFIEIERNRRYYYTRTRWISPR